MRLSVVDTGYFKLDGGAMFGIVPKSIWNRLHPADNNNLCTWAMRCLLIEDGDRKILVDTGLGNKQDEKFFSFFEPHGQDNLLDSIESLMLSPEEITDVIITHFHFDHTGGAISKDEKGNHHPTFPNADYWTNEVHYRWAANPNEREKGSFLPENFIPLKKWNKLKFVDVQQDVRFTDNIYFRFYYGHTEAMMVPYISLPDGRTLVYAADLMPSRHHLRLPYVMAYDIRPLVTVRERKEWYERVTDGNHIVFFEHDKDIECGQVILDTKGRYNTGHTGKLNDFLNPSSDSLI